MRRLVLMALAVLVLAGGYLWAQAVTDGKAKQVRVFACINETVGVPDNADCPVVGSGLEGVWIECKASTNKVYRCLNGEWKELPGTAGGDGVGYDQVQDDGTNRTKRAILNFTGTGVSCVDNPGAAKTDCTITAGAGGTPGAPDTSVQYNKANAFAGEAAFVYNDATDTLTVPTLTVDTISPSLDTTTITSTYILARNSFPEFNNAVINNNSSPFLFLEKNNAPGGRSRILGACDIADECYVVAQRGTGTPGTYLDVATFKTDLTFQNINSFSITTDDTGDGEVVLPAQSISSTEILDLTILDADINATANIALSKLATDPLARGNHTGLQTASTISDFAAQVAIDDGVPLADLAAYGSVCPAGQSVRRNGSDTANECFTAGAASGDVEAVGNCATGECFTGTSGTVLTFDGPVNGDATLTYNDSAQRFDFSKGISAAQGLTGGSMTLFEGSGGGADFIKLVAPDTIDTNGFTCNLLNGQRTFPNACLELVELGVDTTGSYAASAKANRGLLFTTTEIGLIESCNDNEILKWTGAGGWACAEDATGASALTVREVDLSPSVSSVITIQFDQADGFVVSDQTGGVVEIDLDALPEANVTFATNDGSRHDHVANDVVTSTLSSSTWTVGTGGSIAVSGSGTVRATDIPNGTAPTVSSAGQIAIDTTADQLRYFGAAAAVTLHPVQQACAVIENLAAADDNFEFFQAAYPITVTSVGCRCRGTCSTPATFTLEDRGGNAMTITGTNPTCATTGNSTYAAVTAGNGLVAGEGIAFDVTNAVAPETDEYTICVTYTADAQ